jgi:hypothetical protein
MEKNDNGSYLIIPTPNYRIYSCISYSKQPRRRKSNINNERLSYEENCSNKAACGNENKEEALIIMMAKVS